MLVVDTNVVVRYLTDDDATQSRLARKLIATHSIRLLRTVLLETEWVLRSLYGFPRADICEGLRAFSQMPQVSVEDVAQVRNALEWFAHGMDFADALHFAACGEDETFASFDRKLAAAAKKAKAGKVKAL